MVHNSYHDIDETDVFELVAAFQSAGRKKLIMQDLTPPQMVLLKREG